VRSRRFLVLHGWENHRPPGHWQWWLVDRLRADGEQVLYPQLPSPDQPHLEDWLAVLGGEWAQMGGGERVVVAHSLSCLLWLHACARGRVDPPADRVLLVAPPSPAVTRGTPAMAGFALIPDDALAAAVAASSRAPVRLVASDADPYSTEGSALDLYGRPLRLVSELLPGAGHVTIEDGFGPWQPVLAWATRATPLARG
jgi:predicted alpha/beta hydrolase family esterase